MNNDVNTKRLFLGSCIALIVTAMTFAIRARLEGVFGPEGVGLSLEQIGLAFGPAFWGFTLAMVFGGPLVDSLGMKKILYGAFGGHLLGIIVTLLATNFITLFIGTLLIGIGNGLVEAACNPLVATLHKGQKTKMLNRFHVWFPGGIVIGSLVAYFMMDVLELDWRLMVSTLFIPLIIYGYIFFKEDLPQTERVQMGVSTTGMWKACVTPLFLFMAFCMLLTASSELGTNQSIESLLKGTEVSGLLVLALTSGVMALGRAFAGPIAHRISTSGMLLFSAIFSCAGLIWLSQAQGNMIFAAAILFAIGVTFFWPTMLSFVAENVPESGALGLSIMGGLGMFATSIVLPIMGRLMDQDATGGEVLQYMAILPAILIVAFGGLFFYMRNKETPAAA